MLGPSLQVLLLADCADEEFNGKRRAGKDSRGANLHPLVHTPFKQSPASWLQSGPSSPQLDLRCHHAHYGGIGWSFLKTAVLLKALADRMPNKTYYLKMDADALLRPTNLMRFLSFLRLRVDPESPIYFGSALGTYDCATRASDVCRSFTFNKGYHGVRRKRSGALTVRLRETNSWNKLQRQMLTKEEGRHANRSAVKYALGGTYGMSGLALRRLVASDCMRRLAGIRCTKCTGSVMHSAMHTHEDANLGLCMHLHRIPLLQCPCFHLMSLVPHPSKGQFDRTWVPRQALCRAASPLTVHKVKHAFRDGMPESMREDQLCKHPIVVHPIHEPSHFLCMWRALEVRDGLHDEELAVWRRGVSRVGAGRRAAAVFQPTA